MLSEVLPGRKGGPCLYIHVWKAMSQSERDSFNCTALPSILYAHVYFEFSHGECSVWHSLNYWTNYPFFKRGGACQIGILRTR